MWIEVETYDSTTNTTINTTILSNSTTIGNAACNDSRASIDVGLLSYRCTCRLGWEGQNCEVQIDECDSLPCQSGGTCVEGVASFVCVCVEGYAGLYCEEELFDEEMEEDEEDEDESEMADSEISYDTIEGSSSWSSSGSWLAEPSTEATQDIPQGPFVFDLHLALNYTSALEDDNFTKNLISELSDVLRVPKERLEV
eukprot:SAG11_NODE_240_length_11781_cov_78.887690_2_plen_198_part_00